MKALRRFDSRVQAPDYSTIDRRVNKPDVELDDGRSYGDDIVLAVDASGIKVENRGDWIRRKWKVKRGCLKIRIVIDTNEKRIMAMEVTSEKVGDSRRLRKPHRRSIQEHEGKQNIG